jgi:nitrogen fixation protein FixH
MGSENSQQFNVDNEAQDKWEDNDWEGGEVISEDDVLSASDLKERQKKIDIEKAKVRRSIEEFREQKRLRELLGDDFDD